MKVLFAKAIESVLEDVAIRQKPSSHHTYRWAAKMCVQDWGEAGFDGITEETLQAWVYRRTKDGMAPATIKHQTSFLSRCYKMANKISRRNGTPVPPVCPIPEVVFPRINNNRERTLSPAEEVAMHEHMAPIDFSVMQFAIHTGMRRLEQFNLRPEDVQIWDVIEDGVARKKGMARIRDSKTGVGRHCALNIVAAHIADTWIKKGGAYVFFGNRKTQNRIHVGGWFDRTRWRAALKRAGLDGKGLVWHALRHTFASRALQNGARIQDVQKMLGHQSVKQTERYAHWASDALWPAADALVKRAA